jgi:hypothetical protein
MELKINREQIPVTERILEETQEQGIELDYVLPDYDPEIFRIISCELQPAVTDYQLQGDRLNYELQVEIRILYCGNGSHSLQCVTQTMRYSKSLELRSKPENPSVILQAKTDYANCRAVSRRRLDVRGAVSVRIQMTGERTQEVISDLFGKHIQCRKKTIHYASQKQRAVKVISLSEEIELNAAKAPVQTILRCTARAESGEQSIIAGKFVARGEVTVSVLYRSDTAEQTEPENIQFALAYSQIVDMEKIEESFTGMATVQIIRCECKPLADKNGVQNILKCDTDIRLTCMACKPATVQVVTDAYSTAYLCDSTSLPLRIDGIPVPLKEHFSCTTVIPAGDTPADFVSDLQCQIKNVSIAPIPEQNCIRASGMLCCSVLARDAEGMPFLLEKEEAFEEHLSIPVPLEQATLYAEAEPADTSFHLAADGSISIKASVYLHGMLYPATQETALSAVTVDENKKRTRDSDCALRLYYGTIGESVWDIAKRCNTKVSAIAEENELTGDVLTKAGMLFIPIVY